MKQILLLSVSALLAIAATLPAAEKKKEKEKSQDAAAPKEVAWKITGDLEEACSCAAACPCWFDSKPTRMTCDGFQALFIKKGNYGKLKLDGLAVAGTGQSPEGKSMMESFGNWNFAYLYIDEKATPEQREALKNISMQALPANASKKVEVRFVPITRKIDGKEHEVTLGKYGTVRGHLVDGGLGGAPRIVNPPGADLFHKEYEQGTTAKYTYNDADQKWEYNGTNYMQGKFSVDSAEQKKYSVGLAQKMDAMKKEEKK